MPRPIHLVRRVWRLAVPPAASILAAGMVAAPAAAKLTISPAPGTPDVSPQTQISILGVAPSRIASVSVAGAASGAHPGALRRYSRGRGASFVPAQPLAPGERVAVLVRLHGRAPVRLSFTVARLAPIQPVLQIDRTQPAKLQAFVSRPDLTPPRITVNRGSPSPGGGIFITPLPSPVVHPESNNAVTISPVGPGGPMIVDGHGDLVWFKQLTPPDVAANLRLQRYAGGPSSRGGRAGSRRRRSAWAWA